jgi:hypothetical protein
MACNFPFTRGDINRTWPAIFHLDDAIFHLDDAIFHLDDAIFHLDNAIFYLDDAISLCNSESHISIECARNLSNFVLQL